MTGQMPSYTNPLQAGLGGAMAGYQWGQQLGDNANAFNTPSYNVNPATPAGQFGGPGQPYI